MKPEIISAKETIVLGDIHGRFGQLNQFLNRKKAKYYLSVGDFGFWPKWLEKSRNPRYLKPRPKPKPLKDNVIFFCDGNHEDHWSIRDRETDELYPNVYYMPRGSTLKLEDGRTILFMGGAASTDKEHRRLGYDWFPEEEINQKDLYNLPDCKIDIVISHTIPDFFPLFREGRDWSRKALTHIWERYHPEWWFNGHFHTFKCMEIRGTKWMSLDMLGGGSMWWSFLPEIKE